jgi:hypothetical protein
MLFGEMSHPFTVVVYLELSFFLSSLAILYCLARSTLLSDLTNSINCTYIPGTKALVRFLYD